MIETYLERCAREKRERDAKQYAAVLKKHEAAEKTAALRQKYEYMRAAKEAINDALLYGTGTVLQTATNSAPPRINVYDAVNRDRLLGTHPRWNAVDNYRRYATLGHCAPAYYYGNQSSLMYVSDRHGTVKADDILTVDTVELKRDIRVSKDGWDAEVILVTYSPLEHLMRLKDFRLPGH